MTLRLAGGPWCGGRAGPGDQDRADLALLKRQDEKFVTERAYSNPMFVEDVVREIARRLKRDHNIIWFTVESENFESIHKHSAYASIERDKTDPSRDSL